MPTDLAPVVDAVRAHPPLVHCLMATVSMGIVADGLLAAGARPMMTETRAEAPTMDALADALLINLGTLSTDAMAGIPPTVDVARAAGRPWVLDPTAVGVAPVRARLARELVTRAPAVVRGNASEVVALAGSGAGGRGADAVHGVQDALGAARSLAQTHGCVVAVSGDVDLVTDGDRVVGVRAGHPLLTRVTGTGCLLGGLVAACCAVAPPFEAALAASAWLGAAGERAAAQASGPGSFRAALIDTLDTLTAADVAAVRCEEQ
ncbi:hydroxyethylthiazole kinase [Propioniciclava soli]|uniref:Hydroxyethylthiazole kinase n=1 Tax=Propioniciclava soli TaxID=2775081 RepID=A0ABZ3C5Z6_9ACTN